MKKENKLSSFQKFDIFILGFIIVIALAFRVYKVNTPLADYHSWRQVDTASVARNFVREGFDLFHPKFDDISSIQSGIENPKGYRFVEFPIYNSIFAFVYKLLPILSLESFGRLTSAFFSLIVIGILYYLALKEADRTTAIISSLVYAIFPFFVFFSRVILPETTALAFAMMAILFLYLNTHSKKRLSSFILYTASFICFAISLLVKPTTIFYTLVILFIFCSKHRFAVFKKVEFYIYFILIILPLAFWRYYISSFPEGIPPSDWLITSVNTYEGLKNIFFRPAFFRWIFFERINNYIFGGYLTFLFLIGVFAKPKNYLLHIIAIAGFSYLFVFQGGNVQHEYYQTIAFPALALMTGLGASFMLKNTKIFITPIITYSLLTLLFLFSFAMSYYKVKDYYTYPAELPRIANIVTSLTKPDDKIITDRLGDTTLLYLIDRKGAPAIYKDLEAFQNDGYRYFVTLHKEKADEVKNLNKYTVIFENDKFSLFRL